MAKKPPRFNILPPKEWAKIIAPLPPPPFCPVHKKPLKNCGCMPTDDGPADGPENSNDKGTP